MHYVQLRRFMLARMRRPPRPFPSARRGYSLLRPARARAGPVSG